MPDEPQDPQPDPPVTEPSAALEPEPQTPPDWESRFSRLEQQLSSVATLIASRPQATPRSEPSEDVSDADLFRLAQQGDENAYSLWTQRQSKRTFDREYQIRQHEQAIDNQLANLGQRYPSYQDVNHPLTVATRATFQGLVSRGSPNNKGTLLDAMKTAIAENPAIVAEIHAQTRITQDQPRRSAVASAQSGQTRAASRDLSAPSLNPFKVKASSPEELALARRMGIKDPKAAKERFLQRQAGGQSSLGAVSNFVREEDL